MGSWSFHPVLDSYLLVLALGAVLLGLLRLKPSFGTLTPARRRWLWGLRGVIVLLVALALLRPTLVLTSTARQSAALVVLFDRSRSMQLPDAQADRSRWEAQLATLRGIEPQLAGLSGDLDVKVYAYDKQLQALAWQDGKLEWPTAADGAETDLGSSIDLAIRRELGQRVAAFLMFGDGVQTAYDPAVEIHEAGRELARMGTPLYAVPFGRAGAEDQSRDVSVENLPEQYTVFVKNELQLRGVVRVRGYANQPIPVELVVEDEQGQQQVIGPKNIVAREDGQQLEVEMNYTPTVPGHYKLTLRAPEQPGELVTKNNALTAFLTVLEGGLKVAYLYGGLLGEQRYLRWSLESSPDIDLRHVFIDPRNRDRWPDDRSDLLQDPVFDVYLLENVDASVFRPEDLQALAKAVENGRGVMMIGGYHSFGPGGYYASPLRDVLPIEMGRFDRQEPNPLAPISSDLHLNPEGGLLMLPTGPHPITRLADDAENENVWKRLPPLSGANRFARVKQTAQILAESSERAPLLVSGEYGQGRTLAFAGDSTRRWWQYGHQAEHKRFWRQAILWLAKREDDRRSDVWVKLPQRRFPPGATVPVQAGARSAAGDPLHDAILTATLTLPDRTQREISLSKGDEDWRTELRELTVPGDYLLRVTARTGDREVGQAQAVFQLLDQDLELANVAADPDQLARIAALTRDVDGRVVAPEELPQLLAELKQRIPTEQLEVQKRWRLGDTALDAWLFFLLLTSLLSVEWFLRKRWGLV